MDEEALLTHIDKDSQEAIVSNLGLHWVNDIPGQSFVFVSSSSQDRKKKKPRLILIGMVGVYFGWDIECNNRGIEADQGRSETGWFLPGEHDRWG